MKLDKFFLIIVTIISLILILFGIYLGNFEEDQDKKYSTNILCVDENKNNIVGSECIRVVDKLGLSNVFISSGIIFFITYIFFRYTIFNEMALERYKK